MTHKGFLPSSLVFNKDNPWELDTTFTGNFRGTSSSSSMREKTRRNNPRDWVRNWAKEEWIVATFGLCLFEMDARNIRLFRFSSLLQPSSAFPSQKSNYFRKSSCHYWKDKMRSLSELHCSNFSGGRVAARGGRTSLVWTDRKKWPLTMHKVHTLTGKNLVALSNSKSRR